MISLRNLHRPKIFSIFCLTIILCHSLPIQYPLSEPSLVQPIKPLNIPESEEKLRGNFPLTKKNNFHDSDKIADIKFQPLLAPLETELSLNQTYIGKGDSLNYQQYYRVNGTFNESVHLDGVFTNESQIFLTCPENIAISSGNIVLNGFSSTPSVDLTDIELSVSLINSTGGLTRFNFSSNPLETNFNSSISPEGPWLAPLGQFLLFFQANISCSFNFSFSFEFVQNLVSDPAQFSIEYQSNFVEWDLSVQEDPIDLGGTNCTLIENSTRFYFPLPLHWTNFTLSLDALPIFSTVNPIIWLNQSLNDSILHIFAVSSQVLLDASIDPDLQYFDSGDIFNPIVYNNSGEMNVTWHIWESYGTYYENNDTYVLDSAHFLNYSANLSENDANQSTGDILFPDFTVPSNLTGSFITNQVWWHNGTFAGTFYINLPLKLYSEAVKNANEIDLQINSYSAEHSFDFSYQDIYGNPISDGNISISWLSGNYSLQFTDFVYSLRLFAHPDFYIPGTVEYVNISFTHSSYQSQLFTIPVFLLINTTFSYQVDSTTLYFNQTFDITAKWYTESGFPISTTQEESDSAISIEVTLDGTSLNQNWWFFNKTQTNTSISNFICKIYTEDFSEIDFIGDHSINLIFSKGNETTKYESQQTEFIITIIAPEAYLNFTHSNSYQIVEQNNEGIILEEFEDYDGKLELEISYYYHATFLRQANTILPFSRGSIYGRIYDLTNNYPVSNYTIFQSKGGEPGRYLGYFSIQDLSPTINYVIEIYANTTNLAPVQLDFLGLKILPKWQVTFEYHDMVSINENDMFDFSGTVYFNNGSHQWVADNYQIEVEIIFWNPNNNKSSLQNVFTNSLGIFTVPEFKIPSQEAYEAIFIDVRAKNTRYNSANSFNIQIEISKNNFQRIFLPLIIISGIVLVGIPIFILGGRRISEKYLKNSLLYKKMRKIPILKSTLKLNSEISSKLSPEDVESISELRVPLILEGNEQNTDDPFVPYEFVELNSDSPSSSIDNTNLVQFINRTLKDLQLLLSPNRTRFDEAELFARKEEIFQNAVLFEQNGDYYSSAISYSIVQELVKKLNIAEEVSLNAASLERVKQKMTEKEKERYERKSRWIHSFFQRRPIAEKK